MKQESLKFSGRASNPATRKFSPAQIAAQKLFAERARAGTLKQRKKRKPNPGLYENINAKRARIAAGSGEKMRKPGQAGRPTAKAFEQSAMTAKRNPVGDIEMALGGNKYGIIRPTADGYGGQLFTAFYFQKSKTGFRDEVETDLIESKNFKTMSGATKFLKNQNTKTNPDKSKPRAYVKRASQITGAPPSKRLQTRRKMALKAPAGYFPNPEPTHDFARIGKPFAFDGRTWKVSQYSHNGKTIEAYTTDRKKFVRREFDVLELMSSRRKLNPAAAMITGYQVICMHPKKHVVGIFKTMAEAKMVATAMANAKGVAYAVKTVKVHKAHFAV